MTYRERNEWLDGGSPAEVGGRSTDVGQIGFTLTHLLRTAFPINEVPMDLAQEVSILTENLKQSEMMIEEFIHHASNVLDPED